MEISRLNQHCFRIKHKRTIILTDPSEDQKKKTAHILLLSSFTADKDKGNFYQRMTGLQNRFPLKGNPLIIFAPGEYEAKKIRIIGLKEKNSLVYKIKMGGLSLLYLDRLAEKISDEKLELFNHVDILFVSVKKGKAASSLVSQLEPSVVVPIEKEGLETFLKEEGIKNIDKVKKLVVSKGALPEEKEIIVLK